MNIVTVGAWGALWAWMGRNADQLQALSAVAAALTAIWALRRAVADSLDRSRPVVIAEFQRPEHSTSSIDFVVRNTGASPARDLRLVFEPPLVQPASGKSVGGFVVQRYADAIGILGPGQDLRNVWYSTDISSKDNLEQLPERVHVTVSYRRSKWRRWKDCFPLNVDDVRLTTFAVESDSMLGSARASRKALEKIAASTERLQGEYAKSLRVPATD
ncbi:MAG: hypothetical protein L0G49_07895 [Luteococcus sp.]|uniref:hypothetical protein n=1 Tax=Luteococcus sp. TaxID=1969402 RepID=UPI002649C853|nr:hypothetical protein [Luteococcus sp.]MDN5563679.1 hypothetical protein [Luteococcus sp.]